MAIGYSRYLNAIYILGDIFVLNFSFLAVSFVKNDMTVKVDDSFVVHFLYINLIWLITNVIFRNHNIDRIMGAEKVLANLLKTVLVYSLILISLNYLLADVIRPVRDFFIKYSLFVLLLVGWRMIMLMIISFFRKRGLNFRRVIIVGNGQAAADMQSFLGHHPELGYRLQGIFQDSPGNGDPAWKGPVENVQEFAATNATDEIYCSNSGMSKQQVADLVKYCDRNMIRFRLMPDFRGIVSRKLQIDFYESIPVISLRNEPLENMVNRVLKRTFDMVFSFLVILLVISWLVPVVAILIKATSPGPVFFRQRRSGKGNTQFTCLKFRTMVVNKQADERQATKDDVRITRVGRFLRKTNLDELPQFFNVMLGHMSVVGPRPHMLRHTEQYSKLIDKFMVRHLIKPGITGWAQVHGLRGETSDATKMEKRVEYDVWYIENWSLLLDLKIILVTFVKMVSGDENAF